MAKVLSVAKVLLVAKVRLEANLILVSQTLYAMLLSIIIY